MGNGIMKEVYWRLREIRDKFEANNGVKVKKSEVVIRYDKHVKFFIKNKKKTDESIYPEHFEGDEIVRPLGDLKCIMFEYNGGVYARFHYLDSGVKKVKDVAIGRIVDGILKNM